MRIILTLIIIISIISSCDKQKRVPNTNSGTIDSTDSTDTTSIYKDSSLAIVGIDSVVTLGIYDSIVIPFNVINNSGAAQNISLSVSGLRHRLKANLTQGTGVTPMTASLKLNTYLFAERNGISGYSDVIITITATTANGSQTNHRIRLKMDYLKQKAATVLYELYLKNPVLTTYISNNGVNTFIWNGAKLKYDPISKEIYIADMYLGDYSGKSYYSIEKPIATDNFITNNASYIDGHLVFFDTYDLKGKSASDTLDFYVDGEPLFYYLPNDSFITAYETWGVTNRKRYVVSGKLKFD